MARARRGKRNYRWLWGAFAILLAVIGAVLIGVNLAKSAKAPASPTVPDTTGSTATTTAPPKPVSVTVGATGDILMHTPFITNYYDKTTDSYDYSELFTHIQPYYEQMDWMVANLEVTLAGTAYEYQGYPCFNSPDTIVDALVGSGVDMLLTANNHSYDTRNIGFTRTRSVLKTKSVPFIGSRDEEDKKYRVQDVGGIRIGMVNYTYQTARSDGKKALNGILMKDADAPLINSFDYNDLPAFYSEMKQQIAAMKQDGAEAIMLFIHWGNEYQLKPNSYQKQIAAKMCELGVDVIVGGHPHVIQPIEVLTSATGKKTVCAYSVGNEISNQRIAYMDMKTGHTEDGMVFSATFTRAIDGSVSVTGIDVLPTWVHMYKKGSKTRYQVIPLDQTKDFKTSFNLDATSAGAANAQKSYERTMALVSDGLAAFRG